MEKVILYRGGSCNEERIKENLLKMCLVEELDLPCKNLDADGELAEKLMFMIHGTGAGAVFSVDFYPIIAETAHAAGIPYISWIIDAPHYTLYSTASFYDECYIFSFEKEEAERLRDLGRPHVYYCPLASDPERFAAVIGCGKAPAPAEVCFLGSSYQNARERFDKAGKLSEHERGYCDALMRSQSLLYGAALIEGALPEELQEKLILSGEAKWPGTYDLPHSLVAANILENRLSVTERRKMVGLCAKEFGITLYSESEALAEEGVDYRGYADYERVMPLVFASSKINLNQTLRRIHTGIPLRALDVMAAGGFLLSNYQEDLALEFGDGEACGLYGSFEEMADKIRWYLEHEEERCRIARAGQEMVRREYSYEKVLRDIFSAAGLL